MWCGVAAGRLVACGRVVFSIRDVAYYLIYNNSFCRTPWKLHYIRITVGRDPFGLSCVKNIFMQTQKTAGTRIHVDMNPYTNVSTNTIQSAGDMEFGVRPNDVMDSSSKEVDKASFRSISLAWNDINYTTVDKEGKEKKIIHNMSGKANPGELLCIMGTSGAGKSTLLDILAGRLVSTRVGGSVLANGKPVLFSSFRRQSGYVMQSDALFPLLTVKETLFYAASLRIPDKTWAEKEEIVMETMKLLRYALVSSLPLNIIHSSHLSHPLHQCVIRPR